MIEKFAGLLGDLPALRQRRFGVRICGSRWKWELRV